ncbi:hypothetical protein L202_05538 [Cryptococcus amylolentus CBS 6039]|uniref:Uncharacterized protein n=2 Tax=Cryptococcus amylolentus TaxID=104669 RepID=A0A1E3HLH0_9TREE|nr:hypothetical protein L202_05538 [Cryptococcus amylolentus CBS 6039]ODN76975.1 hypothetical protein L202_05538 [Cryptococcus amylolentus CBS 6039]ODO04856.1 hypothetical protein I350_05466 [Cryptococcus amylolentus CBS 6273]
MDKNSRLFEDKKGDWTAFVWRVEVPDTARWPYWHYKDGQHVFVSGPLEKGIDGVYCINMQSMHAVGTFSSSAASSSPYCATPVCQRPKVAFPHEPPVESSPGPTKQSGK